MCYFVQHNAQCEAVCVAAVEAAEECREAALAVHHAVGDEMATLPAEIVVALPPLRGAVASHVRKVRALIERCAELRRCTGADGGTLTVLPDAVAAAALDDALRAVAASLAACVAAFAPPRRATLESESDSSNEREGAALAAVTAVHFDAAVESALLGVQQSRAHRVWLRSGAVDDASAAEGAAAPRRALVAHHRRLCGPLADAARDAPAAAAAADSGVDGAAAAAATAGSEWRGKGLVRSLAAHVGAFASSIDALLVLAARGGGGAPLSAMDADVSALRSALGSRVIVGAAAADLAPFALALARCAEHAAEEALCGLSALCKLEFVVARTFRALLLDGYCDPNTKALQQEAANEDFNAGGGDGGDGGGGGGGDDGDDDDLEDGTGMGDGEGMTDVTDQIQDESQLVGAEQQQPEMDEEGGVDAGPEEEQQEQQDKVDNDDGMEMEDEFDGELRSQEQPEDGACLFVSLAQ